MSLYGQLSVIKQCHNNDTYIIDYIIDFWFHYVYVCSIFSIVIDKYVRVLLCLDTIVCHSIGYTFYDQTLCYVLLLYDMVRPSSVLTSLGFPDVNRGSVWLLSITLYGNLPRNFRLNDVTCTSMN